MVPEDYLIWYKTKVEGRTASYGVGGADGPPVVFLHGWALGSRAYKRAIRRLTDRGCRVFAPALPSFGATADLPPKEMTIAGYADWVASFMDAVGIDEPALVIGHSFGGGVAIKLAKENPDRVRYLILLNALGGLNRRAPWEWLIGFGTEVWPPAGAIGMIQALRADLLPNLVRNPFGIARVGMLAMGTDLRSELSELKMLGVPVLALTSERDRLIPKSAFETVCDAVGADGTVVSGGHAWLLVDPDLFGETLAATIDVEVANHEASRTKDRRAEIERLMKRLHFSKRETQVILDSAAPLWLLSETPAVLAGDLALCRPRLKKDEVRALARHVDGSNAFRLTIVARDRPGLLADSAAVLAVSGLSISQASGTTWQRPKVSVHSFVVDAGGGLDDKAWDKLGRRLRRMVATGNAPTPEVGPLRRVTVSVHGAGDRSMVKVVAPDRTGLLSRICRYFHEWQINIEALRAMTREGAAHDTFLVVGEFEPAELKLGLEQWLTGPGDRRRGLTVVQ